MTIGPEMPEAPCSVITRKSQQVDRMPDAAIGADVGGDDGDRRTFWRGIRRSPRMVSAMAISPAEPSCRRTSAALDDHQAGHLVARRRFEEAGELGAVDLAHRAADELADLGGD